MIIKNILIEIHWIASFIKNNKMTLWTVRSVILSFSFFNFINFMYESNLDIGFYSDPNIKFWWIRVEIGFSFEQFEWWVESLASLQKFYIWIQSGFSFYPDVLIRIKNTGESRYKPDFFFFEQSRWRFSLRTKI